MIIIISTLEVEQILNRALIIQTNDQDTNFGNPKRRQNRIATLDGKSVLQDRGYSNTDLTFKITASEFIQEDFDALRYLLESFPEVRISTRIGSFIGTMSNLSDENANFDFLVTKND